MTDTPPPPSAPAPEPEWYTPAPVQPGSRSVVPGLVALGLAIVALFAVGIPMVSGWVFLIALAAIVLAIVALARRAPMRGLAIAALIVAPIAWVLSILSFFAFLFGAGPD